MPDLKIEIYKTPSCPYCAMAEEYFQSLNLPYVTYDLTQQPEKAQEMMQKSGQTGVPVIVITKGSEEKVIIGFNKGEIDDFLGINNQ